MSGFPKTRWTPDKVEVLVALVEKAGVPTNWNWVAAKCTTYFDKPISAQAVRNRYMVWGRDGGTVDPEAPQPTVPTGFMPLIFQRPPPSWVVAQQEEESRRAEGKPPVLHWPVDWEEVWHGYIQDVLDKGQCTEKEAEQARALSMPKSIKNHYCVLKIYHLGMTREEYDEMMASE